MMFSAADGLTDVVLSPLLHLFDTLQCSLIGELKEAFILPHGKLKEHETTDSADVVQRPSDIVCTITGDATERLHESRADRSARVLPLWKNSTFETKGSFSLKSPDPYRDSTASVQDKRRQLQQGGVLASCIWEPCTVIADISALSHNAPPQLPGKKGIG